MRIDLIPKNRVTGLAQIMAINLALGRRPLGQPATSDSTSTTISGTIEWTFPFSIITSPYGDYAKLKAGIVYFTEDDEAIWGNWYGVTPKNSWEDDIAPGRHIFDTCECIRDVLTSAVGMVGLLVAEVETSRQQKYYTCNHTGECDRDNAWWGVEVCFYSTLYFELEEDAVNYRIVENNQ